MAYVACQMASVSADHQPCVESFGISWNDITQCVASDFATRQQLGYEQVTLPVLEVTDWVPSIAYNGRITELSRADRDYQLKEIICNFIYNTNPACQQQSFF